jgi:N-acetylmuramoyl-L-alanine amidase
LEGFVPAGCIHTFVFGDSILSLAEDSGHFWETIWNASENAELRELRDNPETLAPGDKIYVPEIVPSERAADTAKRHTFRRKGVPARIALQLQVQNGPKFAGIVYELLIGGKTHSGKTDGEGRIDHWLPTNEKKGTLTFWPEEPGYPKEIKMEIEINHLAPADTVQGLQRRLCNLGYDCGGEDGTVGEKTKAAIEAFQEAQGVDVTGVADAATFSKMEDVHGH